MPNTSSQPYASLLPQFDPNTSIDFSKFDISKINFNLLLLLLTPKGEAPDFSKEHYWSQEGNINTLINLDTIKLGVSKLTESIRSRDTNRVLLHTDAKSQLEGTIPEKIETPLGMLTTEDKFLLINNAGSINQNLGQWGDIGVLAGLILGGMIGGLAGTAISRAATGTLTSINAIKNLNSLKGLKGVKGLNTARAGNISALAGSLTSIADSFLGPKSEYSGIKGNVTEGLDSLYDGISDAAMSMGPIGMIAGGAMKVGDFIGDGLNKLGIGTDGMTTQDAILGSSFFSWNVGLVNGLGAKKTTTITKDDDIFANIGSSYSGTNYKVDDAVTKSGKKYGLFSRGAYDRANKAIIEARRLQSLMANISDEATDRRNLRNSMSAFNGIRKEYELQGGYNQANIRVGKLGLKFELTFEGELPNLMFNGELPLLFKFGGELPNLMFNGELPELKVSKFEKGGSFNVIPDGAFHSRKHNIDIEGITLKGIPVIDNEGNLTAEIEKNEIIFRLSVTELLEKLNKIYQSSNKKEKEEAALEAGKLLVYEILNNTIDNTNLIENAT